MTVLTHNGTLWHIRPLHNGILILCGSFLIQGHGCFSIKMFCFQIALRV